MKGILARLSIKQKISILLVALLVGGGLYWVVRQQLEADFKPLFTGIGADDAAGIVQKLKESGVEYRLPVEGGSVLVPSARLAELRLTLAAAGLPKTGRMGFEIFDKTNLGATEFTEHVNYRRALEGELERSIMSLAEVEQARVHLTFPKESVFLEAQQPAKASVLVKVRPGSRIAAQNVVAISHLVGSAVEGLSPDAVSVLDMNGNLLARPRVPDSPDSPAPSEATLDYRRRVEGDILAKINSALEPLLGADKFRAGVSVECDLSGGEQSEEIFDPARTVMVNSQRTEDAAGPGSANGVPGSASTLPRPTSRPGTTAKAVTRSTESITYQSTRTVKKTHLPAGAVRKMSLAVLVDHDLKWEPQGSGYKRVLAAPTPEKLQIIRDVVAGVTGFSADRGDQIVIESLPFETTLSVEPPSATPVAPRPPPPPSSPLQIIQSWDKKTRMMVGGGVAGVLLLVFVAARLMGRKRPAPTPPSTPAALPAGEASATPKPALPATPSAVQTMEDRLAEHEAMQHRLEEQALSNLKLAPVITKTSEVLAKHLREKIAKEPAISAQLLRTWITEEDTP
jgi:flagellar M-ring protein FliF